jgi:hypothetical protein
VFISLRGAVVCDFVLGICLGSAPCSTNCARLAEAEAEAEAEANWLDSRTRNGGAMGIWGNLGCKGSLFLLRSS